MKPSRLVDKRENYARFWWRYAERRPGLFTATQGLSTVLAVNCGASPHLGIAVVPARTVFANTLVIFAFSNFAPFAVLQSRIHEAWVRFFSSSMKDDLRYTPSDCFRTFPENFGTDPSLEAAGEAYHAFRAQLMIDRNEGLTKNYNRFHARDENASDIVHLRTLHAEMDAAVLRAYGLDDLAACARPEFIEQNVDEGKTPKTRFDWPAEFKPLRFQGFTSSFKLPRTNSPLFVLTGARLLDRQLTYTPL